MAIENFIPEVWSARVLAHLNKALVYGNVVNRDYESEISAFGDTVNINQIADVTIFDYTKNTDFAGGAETLTGTQTTLLIDQGKAFNFQIDDVDKAQQNPKIMDYAMSRAAYGLADAMDVFLGGLYTGVAAANIVGLGNDTTPVVPTKDDIYGYFTTAAQLLDEANVPTMERWAVIPPWMLKMLRDSGEMLSDTAVGDGVRSGGVFAGGSPVNSYYGKIAGFDVLVSNNVANTAGAKYKVQFGYPGAISAADSFLNMEAYRPELRFGDAVKGLHVYGGKLVQSTGIAVMTASKA